MTAPEELFKSVSKTPIAVTQSRPTRGSANSRSGSWIEPRLWSLERSGRKSANDGDKVEKHGAGLGLHTPTTATCAAIMNLRVVTMLRTCNNSAIGKLICRVNLEAVSIPGPGFIHPARSTWHAWVRGNWRLFSHYSPTGMWWRGGEVERCTVSKRLASRESAWPYSSALTSGFKISDGAKL